MFIKGEGPPGAIFNNGQGVWGPTPETAFAFDLADPNWFQKQNLQNLNILSAKQAAFRANLQNMATGRGGNIQPNFSGQKQEPQQYQLRANDYDQSMVWFQNMEDPNDAFRGPPGSGHHAALSDLPLAPGQAPHHVQVPSSSSKHHGNVHARRQTNLNPGTGGVKTETDANLWSTASNSANVNVNHGYPQPINFQGTQRWAPDPSLSSEYIQGYGFPDNLADGLPNLPYGQPVGSAFELGQAAGVVPNLDSSSSSSCRVNGSSPNTVFGSFSSSIGPADLMDMGAAEECFHSPSAFPSEAPPPCPQPGTIPQALLSRSAAHNFGISPGMVLAEAETVSPKMLNLKNVPSLPSSSSSESLPNPFHMDSDSEAAPAVAQTQESILSSSAWQQKREPGPKPGATGRKQLPDKAPHSKAPVPSSGPKRRHGGEVPGDKSSAPSSKKSKAKTKAPSQSKSQPQPASHSNKHHHHHHRSTGGSESRAKSSHTKASSSSSKAAAGAVSKVPDEQEPPSILPRSDKDEFLVQSKLSGMTYKEIRKMGGFTEAESTLRGRFRTLTKPKEARVRKPEFQEIDDKLLKRAVVKFTKDVDRITRDNVPWKQVAEYMVDHGGSYLFGYTTVRKRWEYLAVTSDEQVKQDRLDHKFQN